METIIIYCNDTQVGTTKVKNRNDSFANLAMKRWVKKNIPEDFTDYWFGQYAWDWAN